MNIFWETIAQYNAGTWIYQLIITLVGLWLTYSLFHHPTPAKKKGMKLYLIFINAWVAVVYYHIYCDPRSYSNATSRTSTSVMLPFSMVTCTRTAPP